MSQKEFQRVKVIENAVAGRLSVSEAARLLQRSERQVQRLKRRERVSDDDTCSTVLAAHYCGPFSPRTLRPFSVTSAI